MTWRPKCQRCDEVIEPGQPRRRLYDTNMAARAGFWWLKWGCYLHPECYQEIEAVDRGETVGP